MWVVRKVTRWLVFCLFPFLFVSRVFCDSRGHLVAPGPLMGKAMSSWSCLCALVGTFLCCGSSGSPVSQHRY